MPKPPPDSPPDPDLDAEPDATDSARPEPTLPTAAESERAMLFIPGLLLGGGFGFNMYCWLFTDPAAEHHIEHYLYYAIAVGFVLAIQIAGGTGRLVVCLRVCAIGWFALMAAFIVWTGRGLYEEFTGSFYPENLMISVLSGLLSLIPLAILYYCGRTNWRVARHLMAERTGQFLDENYLPEPPPRHDD